MNPFVIDTVVAAQSSASDSHFPLQRATDLRHVLATIFSRHLATFGADGASRRKACW